MGIQSIKQLREERQKELNQIAGEIAEKSNPAQYDGSFQEQVIPVLESLLQKTYETYHIKIKQEIEASVTELKAKMRVAENKEVLSAVEAELQEIEAQARQYEIEILFEVLSVGGVSTENKQKIKQRLVGLGVSEESVDQHMGRY